MVWDTFCYEMPFGQPVTKPSGPHGSVGLNDAYTMSISSVAQAAY